MSTFFGEKLKIEVYGSSHGPSLGVKIWGLPEGAKLDEAKLQEFLDRRAPGKEKPGFPFAESMKSVASTSRKEPDKVKILKGLSDGKITSGEFQAEIENVDVKSASYEDTKYIPRPGHSDLAQYLKTGEILPGGGEYSGRMTAALCIAGGIAKQLLEEKGIKVKATIYEIAGEHLESKMEEKVFEAAEEGDSVGGIIQCLAEGLEPGIGGPLFDRFETGIARALFSIPAVKGVEFGSGFASTKMKGSENNDAFFMRDDKVLTRGNNHGGVLGGVTSGNALLVKVAIKPTPTISKKQMSVNLKSGENVEVEFEGRHDVCIVPRALPVVEAMVSIAIYDRI